MEKYFNLKRLAPLLVVVMVFAFGAQDASAQTNPTSASSYVPLIGITSVPDPLALPKGSGMVMYHYAVKNLLQGAPLIDVNVIDNICSSVTLVSGDDNGDGKLEYGETWRYACTTTLSTTTQSTATATGSAGGSSATHNAFATVVVGSDTLPPLVSIVDITKISYPLPLPSGGGPVTFTYKVTNPGVVPLSNVTVKDDTCSNLSGELGDTNGNHLLDPSEVWIFTCTATLSKTTTNTARVTAYANGLQAIDDTTLTVDVAASSTALTPGFPNEGSSPNIPGLPNNGTNPNTFNTTTVVWGVLGGILAALVIVFLVTRKGRRKRNLAVLLAIIVFLVVGAGAGYYILFFPRPNQPIPAGTIPSSVAWKFPVSFLTLPAAGAGVPVSSAYSTIPVPGGVPQAGERPQQEGPGRQQPEGRPQGLLPQEELLRLPQTHS